ncbi:hypothetical protein GCM10025869_28250 [Homoserinibacter gongjuensis]|uniref:HTH araC/xylS-type domain-containing protein n=1 Tax=Homoserinibacter gongjuensis TaxID=1162968 RepID=A0ABQ6JXR3_9MICO|nr:hypothetical protein GCM10025869_28250 [Homoserinibacter gongjuensis]
MSDDTGLFEMRYRALASRDARFDGQFIAGVRTTGIYCRPSCPAVTPKPGNVTFYRTAAAAHEAGLRACKRCQPDAIPGSPDWNLRDDLAARAMRLVQDGVVEREGVEGLAQRLGYSSRHLTRVLTAELGAGPLALARAHRAQTARTLLASTELSIAGVAFAAGFGSLRQFNDTIAEIYRATPSELRALSRRGRAGVTPPPSSAESFLPGTLSLRLAARAPWITPGSSGSSPTMPSPASSTATRITSPAPCCCPAALPSSRCARMRATAASRPRCASAGSPTSEPRCPASAVPSISTRMPWRSTRRSRPIPCSPRS